MRTLATATLAASLCVACSSETPSSGGRADAETDATTADGGADDVPTGPEGDPGPPPPSQAECEPGEAPTWDFGCVAVGAEGECAALFLGEDGVCRPEAALCPAGQIPDRATGCVPVGPAGCAEAMVSTSGATEGLCVPADLAGACAPNEVPRPLVGCEATGLSCAFTRDAEGVCEVAADACQPGELPTPVEGCVPLGACGGSPWGAIEQLPGDVHVDPTFVGESDGSREAPWATLAAGVAAAPDLGSGRLVLAMGAYAEGLLLDRAIEVVGACAAGVVLSGVVESAEGPAHVVASARADGAELERVRLEGLNGQGIVAEAGAVLSLLEVEIAGASGNGILASGAGTQVKGSLVRVAGTRPDPATGEGRGVMAESGARLTLSAAALIDNREAGAAALSADLVLNGVLIADTEGNSDEDYGVGVAATLGGTATLSDVALRGNRQHGLLARHEGTVVTVEGLEVSDTRGRESDGADGEGLRLTEGAALSGAGVLLARNRAAGAAVFDSQLSLEGCLIQDTEPNDNGALGGGVDVYQAGGSATLRGCGLLRNHAFGARAADGATLTLEDCAVAATKPLADGTSGYGLDVESGASLDVVDSVVGDVLDSGIVVDQAVARVERTVVAGIEPSPGAATRGYGLAVQSSAELTLRDSAVIEGTSIGISVGGFSTVTLERNLVRGTRPTLASQRFGVGVALATSVGTLAGNAFVDCQGHGIYAISSTLSATGDLVEGVAGQALDARLGHGVHVKAGSTVELEGLVVRATHEAGIAALEAGTTLTVRDSRVIGAKPSESGEYPGLGVMAFDGAEVDLEGTRVEGVRGVGLAVEGEGSRMTMKGGLVAGTSSRLSGELGAGAIVQDGGSLTVEDTAFVDAKLAGVIALGASLTLVRAAIDEVGWATLVVGEGAGESRHDVSDGVLAALGAAVEVSSSHVAGCERAAMVFDGGEAAVSVSEALGCTYGIVGQGVVVDAQDNRSWGVEEPSEPLVVPDRYFVLYEVP